VSSNHEILKDDAEVLAVKVNLAAFDARLILRGKADPSAELAWNGPYFWGPLPIGRLEAGGHKAVCLPSKGNRPAIQTDKFSFEAGPLLVAGGLVKVVTGDSWVYRSSMTEGKFRPDVARKCDRLCVGLTGFGKLIVAHLKESDLMHAAYDMHRLGSIWAMTCDSGSSAALRVGDKARGNPIRFGIELYPRSKA
jgi:hypothetical protein